MLAAGDQYNDWYIDSGVRRVTFSPRFTKTQPSGASVLSSSYPYVAQMCTGVKY